MPPSISYEYEIDGGLVILSRDPDSSNVKIKVFVAAHEDNPSRTIRIEMPLLDLSEAIAGLLRQGKPPVPAQPIPPLMTFEEWQRSIDAQSGGTPVDGD
jgi:hypothetical protein